MADDLADRLRDAEERLASIAADLMALMGEVRGRTGQGGLKHDVANVRLLVADHGARMNAIEQATATFVATADAKIDELRLSAARASGAEGQREQTRARWTQPILVGVLLIVVTAAVTAYAGRSRPDEIRTATTEAVTEALKQLRVKPEAP